jgi:hypothetical protein
MTLKMPILEAYHHEEKTPPSLPPAVYVILRIALGRQFLG